MKEVTEGVRDVELEDGKSKSEPTAAETEVEGDVGKTDAETTTAVGAEEAAAVPLPDSPELKAMADGEEKVQEKEDADADAEGEDDVEPGDANAVSAADSEASSSTSPRKAVPSVDNAHEDVPGLSHIAEKTPTVATVEA